MSKLEAATSAVMAIAESVTLTGGLQQHWTDSHGVSPMSSSESDLVRELADEYAWNLVDCHPWLDEFVDSTLWARSVRIMDRSDVAGLVADEIVAKVLVALATITLTSALHSRWHRVSKVATGLTGRPLNPLRHIDELTAPRLRQGQVQRAVRLAAIDFNDHLVATQRALASGQRSPVFDFESDLVRVVTARRRGLMMWLLLWLASLGGLWIAADQLNVMSAAPAALAAAAITIAAIAGARQRDPLRSELRKLPMTSRSALPWILHDTLVAAHETAASSTIDRE